MVTRVLQIDDVNEGQRNNGEIIYLLQSNQTHDICGIAAIPMNMTIIILQARGVLKGVQDMIKIYVTVDERGFLKGELQSKGVQDMITIYNCR